MQILGYTPQRHFRFYIGSDRAFAWDSYNWTGIAATIFGGGAMISPSFGITCSHGGDFTGAYATFYYNNDGTAGSITVQVEQVWLNIISGHDCALFKLASPLPAGIQPFAIGSGFDNLEGTEVLAYAGGTVGRNNIYKYYTGPGYYEEFITSYDSFGFNPDEFWYQVGDSGGTLFTVIGGQLVLIGEHHAHAGNGAFGSTSYDSSISASDVLAVIQGIVNAAGENLTVISIPSPPLPVAPTGLIATLLTNGQVQLQWNNDRATNSYNVYRGVSSGSESLYQTNESSPGQATVFYNDASVTPGTTYYYKITGVNGGGEGPRSSEVSIRVATNAPVNLAAVAGKNQISLSWSELGPFTSFSVYRGLTSNSLSKITSGIAGLSYLDSSVTNGIQYFYKVTATGIDGETGFSNIVSAIPSSSNPFLTSYVELYSDPNNLNSNNLNGGSDRNPALTVTGGTVAQGSGTGGLDRFTAASGTPFANAQPGQVVSIYPNGATGSATFLAVVQYVIGGGAAIDYAGVGSTGWTGTRPSNGSGMTATVGGPWVGSSGSTQFPFNNSTLGALSISNRIRVNLIGSFSMTGSTVLNFSGNVVVQGCSSSPNDGGFATIDVSGTTGSSGVQGSSGVTFRNIIFRGNSNSSSSQMVQSTSSFEFCIFVNAVGNGTQIACTASVINNCEFYNCSVGCESPTIEDCTFHNCLVGIITDLGVANTITNIFDCIFFGNITNISVIGSTDNGSLLKISNCDFYDNTLAISIAPTGLLLASSISISECNFGLNSSGAVVIGSDFASILRIVNCGFCTGSFANGSDITNNTTMASVDIQNKIIYTNPQHPWADPNNGDFSTISVQAQKTSTSFLLTQGGLSKNTIGYSSVGAATRQSRGLIF